MRAAVYTAYGPPEVVSIKDVKKPEPLPNEVLVRVRATTVSAADWRLRKADPFITRIMNGLTRPKRIPVLGAEFAGIVESVGNAVTNFNPGDAVFGSPGMKFGAHAEYVCVPEDGQLLKKPTNMSFDEAAAVLFGAASALHFLTKAKVQAGQNVLVYGASGSVGVFAVQLGKHLGARVTAVCSTVNLDLVKSLGADRVLDYTTTDFSKDGRIYDVVFDAVGYSGYSRAMKSLKRGGHYVQVGGSGGIGALLALAARGIWSGITGEAKLVTGMAKGTASSMTLFKDLIEAGKLRTVIDTRYPLSEIAAAHRHAEGGHKKGHVVVQT